MQEFDSNYLKFGECGWADEHTVGFSVGLSVGLTAIRVDDLLDELLGESSA